MFKNLLFALLFITCTSFAQSNFKSFIPPGDKLDTLTRGDLNKDSIDDIVLVTEHKQSDTQTPSERTLLILFGEPDGTYQLNTKSTTAVVGKYEYDNCFFMGVTIKKGILYINHAFLRGGSTHLFRYQNGGFYLIGASSNKDEEDHHTSIEYNLSTGKYITTNNKTKNEGTQKPATLPKLETYKLFSLEINDESL